MVKEEWSKEEELMETLKLLAPGTPLREGLENLLRAKTGALIVIADSQDIMEVVDGGFHINIDFSPAYIYELGKMDGAIILSYDAKKILYANAQLIPDSSVPSSETGIRHRTAERVAKETGEIVIAISQRRNIITLYKGYHKYIIQDPDKILTKANQAIQTLEKYKISFDKAMTSLSALEFEDLVTVYDVAVVLQRTEMVMKIAYEIEKFIYELGNEGRLVSMQLEELVANVKEDGKHVIYDYKFGAEGDYEGIEKAIKSLTSEELLNLNNISKILGYGNSINALDLAVSPKGYRILTKIPRLPLGVIENLVKQYNSFQKILKASIGQLDEVEGIGEIRARAIKEGLRRLQEQVLLERHI
ncbi:DNA integrity scanning protein DisA [Clostridium aceticum]|uniref:DNA integrity scanning protein DisA n=1 Tax=Clostridium aceticum TaxID=84022 RepID=A0A0D8I7P4_9CLOT|nr:DNA integrity scanning diadenylate cyclase DisA [Clostridium aceticum]AKL97086.1 DNA integrity scanning protein DisA [Clostridium aceticum]KJF26042.1 DNA integrity scanning protein DisA [Clostridium aceticum]